LHIKLQFIFVHSHYKNINDVMQDDSKLIWKKIFK